MHSYYGSEHSGENQAVDDQATELRRAGHSVELFAARTSESMDEPFFEVRAALRTLSGKGKNPTVEISKFKPDLIHVHNLFPNWSRSWLKSIEVPIVVTLHNYRLMCAAGTLNRGGVECTLCPTRGTANALRHSCYRSSALATVPLAIQSRNPTQNPILSRANQIVLLSDRALRRAGAFHGDLVNSKASVVPNFVQPFSRVEALGSLPPSYWIYVGRLSPEKGITRLVDAWPPEVPLRIYGDGPDLPSVRNSISSNKIRALGSLPNSVARATLQGAIGLVFTSSWDEGCPLSYLEALEAGVPVLSVGQNSVSDDVALNGTGIAQDSYSGLRSAIAEIVQDRKSISAQSKSHYERNFSPSIWLNRINVVYEQAIRDFAVR